jgi:hypothetical protein
MRLRCSAAPFFRPIMSPHRPSRRYRVAVHALSFAIAFSALLDGCAADRSSAPVRRPIVRIVSGDRQSARAGEILRERIVVVVADENDVPMADVAIRWSATDDGKAEALQSVTDAYGHAAAAWTLGRKATVQHAHASADNLSLAEFEAAVVDGAPDPGPITGAPQPKPTTEPPDPGPITELTLTPLAEFSQTVHPDHVSMPATWAGAHQYLAITPYPGGSTSSENPSLFASTTDIDWTAPVGVQNPLTRPPAGAYLSDPDAVFVPETNELWVYYRQVDSFNTIRVIRSSDGVNFSSPVTVAQGPNHQIVSPSIVRRGPGDWLMWSVNANDGCTASSTTVELRRSSNGLDWSSPEQVNLSQSGFFVWHIDVQWIPSRSEFWAVYNVKDSRSCSTPALYLATSADGRIWKTYPSPILARGTTPLFTDIVYRSTFAYEPRTDLIRLWYSGATFEGTGYVWRSAFQQRSRAGLFAAVARPPLAASTAAIAEMRNVPPLLNAP